jgi:hypothetical protein
VPGLITTHYQCRVCGLEWDEHGTGCDHDDAELTYQPWGWGDHLRFSSWDAAADFLAQD